MCQGPGQDLNNLPHTVKLKCSGYRASENIYQNETEVILIKFMFLLAVIITHMNRKYDFKYVHQTNAIKTSKGADAKTACISMKS